MASFHFCETYLLHIKLFVGNQSAIYPFLGGKPISGNRYGPGVSSRIMNHKNDWSNSTVGRHMNCTPTRPLFDSWSLPYVYNFFFWASMLGEYTVTQQ